MTQPLYLDTNHGKKLILDRETYDKVKDYTWSYNQRNKQISSCIKRTPIGIGRFILDCTPGDGIVIDHINGNTLDNRMCNLRKTTKLGNNRNSSKAKNGKLKYKGITRNGKGYGAQITVNYQWLGLGTYKTQEEAALAYNEAAKIFFGEFAKLNEVPSV